MTTSLINALSHPLADKRLQILRAVQQRGSISQAAREVGVSYKAAWQALETLSNLAGSALVQRSVGGAGGGGAQLTVEGQKLLEAASALSRKRQEAAKSVSARLGLHTSMRNQWPVVVLEVHQHGALAEVSLQFRHAPDLKIKARITAESAQLLGLMPGLELLALAKATALEVRKLSRGQTPDSVSDSSNALDGSINTWEACAVRLKRGQMGDEVVARISGTSDISGVLAVGFAPASSQIRARGRVVLHLPSSAVVLAQV